MEKLNRSALLVPQRLEERHMAARFSSQKVIKKLLRRKRLKRPLIQTMPRSCKRLKRQTRVRSVKRKKS